MADCEDTKRRVRRAPLCPNLDTLPPSALLTDRQVELLSGFGLSTLKAWRKVGRGPRVTEVEGHPRYIARDVQTWLAGQTSNTEAA